jgi:16S rRNA G966 N2-methylase RsmD
MSKVVTVPDNKGFLEEIDSWVKDRVTSGETSFARLVASLPGVYPSVVAASLARLAMLRSTKLLLNQSTESTSVAFQSDSGSFGLPTPHPLDFDWRFSRTTVRSLLDECLTNTEEHDAIAFLGAPSLFAASRDNSSRSFVLVDKNSLYATWSSRNHTVVNCDLMRTVPRGLQARLVVADPPWYPEHQLRFLYQASRMCLKHGKILVTVPKAGTRPNIESEWNSVLQFATSNGLRLEGQGSIDIVYNTPPFERNALRAEGILSELPSWRHADLAVLSKQHDMSVEPPPSTTFDEWPDSSSIRIRLYWPEVREFRDPSLLSVVPGDILGSVSRRSSARMLADVWTSNNRIFGCKGTHILRVIKSSLERGNSPMSEVQSFLGRNLVPHETRLVLHATEQLVEVSRIERQEQRDSYQ